MPVICLSGEKSLIFSYELGIISWDKVFAPGTPLLSKAKKKKYQPPLGESKSLGGVDEWKEGGHEKK